MKEKEININWSAPEYRYQEKSGDWFWYLASAALLAAIVAILLKNFLLAVLVVLAGLTLTIAGASKPRLVNFSIGPKGVRIGEHLLPFKELESFCLNYDPPFKKELALKQKKKLGRLVKLPLAETDPNQVRNLLLKVLPEEEFEESLIELIAERIGI